MRRSGFVVVAVLAASCASSTVEQTRWVLTEAPVGSELSIRAESGGSSCTSFREWRVEESPEAVEVVATIERSGGKECTADLAYEDVTLDLEAPLEQRTLRGCQPDDPAADCRRVVDAP